MRVYVFKHTRCALSSKVCIIVLMVLILLASTLGNMIEHIQDSVMTSVIVKASPVIVLDPGHGGEDCGAIGTNGVYEKDLNLAVALTIGQLLEDAGITVIYTRTEDKMLYKPEENIKGLRKISDLKGRCEIAHKYENSIFVSIHMNSYGEQKYSGLQVYYSPNSENSSRLAESIQLAVKNDIQPDNNRKVKNGSGIYLMKNITTEAVLVECGFLTNFAECEKLSEKEYQKQLSFSIVCGIIEHIKKTR